jgi:DNA invertase Pin-like site-specific DNA recombinase
MYLAYLRKSRKDLELEARGEGETLARHEAALKDLSARLNKPIAAFYREVVSADSIAARPVMQRVLQEVESGMWEGVFVVETERLARGETIDQGIVAQAFKYSNTLIITPMKIYDPSDEMDEEYFEFSLFMSRREYKTITRRLQGGRVTSVREGKYMGSRPPFGYRRVKVPKDKGYTLEIVPEKAAIVRMVFDWYLNGLNGAPAGGRVIANQLKLMGLKTDLGNDFDGGYVRLMLQNIAYVGYVRWNQKKKKVVIQDGQRVHTRVKSDALIVKGLHAPIIDDATFEAVQKKFRTRAQLPIKTKSSISNPLAGLVKCGVCGMAMVRKPDYAGRPDQLYCSTEGCPCFSTYIPIVERSILEILRSWIRDFAPESDDTQPALTPEDDSVQLIVKQMETELRALEQQKNKLYDLLEREVYTIELFSQRSGELDARIQSIRDGMSAALEQSRSRENAILRIIPTVRTVIASYEAESSPRIKNDLLRSVISEIVYHKSKRCFRNEDPSQYLVLDVFPFISKSF